MVEIKVKYAKNFKRPLVKFILGVFGCMSVEKYMVQGEIKEVALENKFATILCKKNAYLTT